MKTRDLMQGDKVYETLLDDTPQVVTVEEVGQNHIYIGMEDDDVALLRYEPEHLGWNIKHIEPIPLTEEILKANGWEKNDPRWTSSLKRCCVMGNHKWSLSCWIQKGEWDMYIHNGGDMQINKFHPMYVHELQHALRLCGLTELADNFKIK